MIWLIGYGRESTFRHSISRLAEVGLAFSVLDLDLLETCEVASHEFYRSGLTITFDGVVYEVSCADVLYLRVYRRQLGSAKRSAYQGELLDAIAALSEVAISVNPMSATVENGLKLFHLARLHESGFAIPRTHAGLDGGAAGRVVQPDGRWISKGCSGVRTEVRAVSKEDYGQLDLLPRSPVQFQEHVQGDDVRVHLIGKAAVAVRIRTDATDYRYASRDGHEIDFRLEEIPGNIRVMCREAMSRTGLVFGGFDFRVEGDSWTVLECNAMPGYDFYDRRLDGAISMHLASCLEALERGSRRVPGVELAGNSRECFLEAERRPRTNHS